MQNLYQKNSMLITAVCVVLALSIQPLADKLRAAQNPRTLRKMGGRCKAHATAGFCRHGRLFALSCTASHRSAGHGHGKGVALSGKLPGAGIPPLTDVPQRRISPTRSSVNPAAACTN